MVPPLQHRPERWSDLRLGRLGRNQVLVAQRIEQWFPKPRVAGSIPAEDASRRGTQEDQGARLLPV